MLCLVCVLFTMEPCDSLARMDSFHSRISLLEDNERFWKNVPVLSSRMTALEQRRLPEIQARMDIMAANILELQRHAQIPGAFSLKAKRALASEEGSDGAGDAAATSAPEPAPVTEIWDPPGFEGLTEAEVSQTSIQSVANSSDDIMHTNIRARIDAIELRLREMNSNTQDYYIGTPHPQSESRGHQGGVH